MPTENFSQKRYLNIQEGALCEKMPDDTISRYRGFTGHLVNITYQTIKEDRNDVNSRTKGELLCLHMIDEDSYAIIKTWTNSLYAKTFYAIMENIQLKDAFTLAVALTTKDGKKSPALFITQNGERLTWKYKRDNLGNCPPLEVSQVNGKTVYDDTNQMLFYMQRIEAVILPALQMKLNPYPNHPEFRGLMSKGNAIAGNHFGEEQKYGPRNHQASATHEPGVTDAAHLTEPLDDLPF